MGLKTTTWENRNTDKIKLLVSEAEKKGIINPKVSVIGPGGIAKPFSKITPKGSIGKNMKTFRFLLHQIESLSRKTNLLPLRSFETEEIINEISSLNPAELTVYDIQKKVLNSIQLKPENYEIKKVIIDLCTNNFKEHSDIVFAHHVIERTTDPETALKNISEHLSPGGLVSITAVDRLVPNYEKFGLEKLNDDLFQKKS